MSLREHLKPAGGHLLASQEPWQRADADTRSNRFPQEEEVIDARARRLDRSDHAVDTIDLGLARLECDGRAAGN